MNNTKLDAITLQATLWETLEQVRTGQVGPATASAIAAQAREILRAVRLQLSVLTQAARPVPQGLIDFVQPPAP